MSFVCRIQHDWPQSIEAAIHSNTTVNEKDKDFWIQSYYHPLQQSSHPTLHATISSQYNNQDHSVHFQSNNSHVKIKFFALKDKKILISSFDDREEMLFQSATKVFDNPPIHTNSKRIECLDVSEGGTVGISGSTDGQVRLWDASSGTLRRDLEGHFGDIYVCKILPSAQVAMTSGSDMQIKIWRISDGLNAVTLKGHKAPVTSISFIERGRNFISSSKDGSIKLWDCASQSCITTLLQNKDGLQDIMNTCYIQSYSSSSTSTSADAREFATQNKLAICGSQKGTLSMIDVSSRTLLQQSSLHSSIQSVCSNGNQIVAGLQSGTLLSYDLRMMNSSTVLWQHEQPTSILQVIPFSSTQFVYTTHDGSCLIYDTTKHKDVISLTGSDYDPLYGLAVASLTNTIYTGCRDGKVRMYKM